MSDTVQDKITHIETIKIYDVTIKGKVTRMTCKSEWNGILELVGYDDLSLRAFVMPSKERNFMDEVFKTEPKEEDVIVIKASPPLFS